MPSKAARVAPLPDGLAPLLTQPQLQTYYNVSDWTVLQWIDAGMPVEPMSVTGEKKQRRFDLDAVKSWHAEREQLAATA